ncbi:MAG: DUF1559 domain-containing protein [Phycisphaerae bacterium]|nr:DUF1559 domain-containing protein [Phycisphaerae bacterium]
MKSRGFTLIELLVVITIILLLIAILSPALRSAWTLSHELKCMNNLRQLVLASTAYAKEHKGRMPFPNWLFGGGWSEPVPGGGWGYAVPSLRVRHVSRAPLNWQYNSGEEGYPWTNEPAKVKTGQLWPYIGKIAVYWCPSNPHEEMPSEQENTTRELSSYRFNGALIAYGGSEWRPFFSNEFRGDDIFVWEADRFGPGDDNDLADYPSEFVASHHRDGAMVGCIDGHVEWIHWEAAIEERNKLGRNRFRCSPR